MLVYAANLRFRRGEGPPKVLAAVGRWLATRGAPELAPSVLARPGLFRLYDGSQVQTWSETTDSPHLHVVRLTHGDRDVSGRQWQTDVGVEDGGEGEDLRVTVLLQTNEISARVRAPVQTSRPRLIETLLADCDPSPEVPGLRIASLTLESARGFDYLVTDERRSHPLVVVSPTGSGTYLVDVERVRSLVAGLAGVVRIPPDTDTFALADLLGKDNVAWLGAVNVIFPPYTRSAERLVPRSRLMPERIEELAAEGRSPESELLSIVAHRMNLANARRQIRPEEVRELTLRREISRRRAEAERAGSTAELLPLYEEADRAARERVQELSEWNNYLETEVESLEDERRNLSAQVENLKAGLEAARLGRTALPEVETLRALVAGDPTLEQSLEVLSSLYSDRIVVLDSAWKSARDAVSFVHRPKAFALLHSLVTTYWEALAAGQGDGEARRVLGGAYAPRESETVENNRRARELRTFDYGGRQITMWKHLKIGVKPSAAETLRVHFEWVDNKIVIGHCGSHLDHS